MRLYSTLDRKVVEIEPIVEGEISMYNCGPTVYSRMHVGNIRAYVSWDILHRAFLYLGFKVKRVMNFTDVGHMVDDDDFGEDKVERAASLSGQDPLELSNGYIRTVLEDFHSLHILTPSGEVVDVDMDLSRLEQYGWVRATSYIDLMIERIKEMEQRGYTYETDLAVYFDVTKIDDYTIFTGQQLEEKSIASREGIEVDAQKRNPADFVLWMKRVGKYANHLMHWSSPWGDGFPGWHIECSVMGVEKLGEHFDIHTGGVDHMSVHHPNERAQNIGFCGHPVVKYWIHNEFIVDSDDGKLSKSKGDAPTLPELVELGYDPLDVRYLLASVNYRVQLRFSKESLDGARSARLKMFKRVLALKEVSKGSGNILVEYKERFKKALNDNLNMSEVFAILNDLLKSQNSTEDILATVYDFDRVLGFDLENIKDEQERLPEDVEELVNQREVARESKDFEESDRLRDLILEKGYRVLDTSDGQVVEKI
ncbi:MAG: cysteine--tRNA ligase [Candidatus Dojkabacteria bacterium]